MQNRIRQMNVNLYGLAQKHHAWVTVLMKPPNLATLILACWLLAGCEGEQTNTIDTELMQSRQYVLEIIQSDAPGVARETADRLSRHVEQYDDIEFFASLLRHNDSVIRKNVAMALSYAPVGTNFRLLRKGIDDESEDVRKAVLRALVAQYPERSQFAVLLSLKDGHWKVRATAVEAAGKLKDPVYISKLCQMLGDRDEYVRYEVIRALCQFAGHGHSDEVLEGLQDVDEQLPAKLSRRVELLVRLTTGDKGAAESLLDHLYSGDWTLPLLSLQKVSSAFPELTMQRLSGALKDNQVPQEHMEAVTNVIAIAPEPKQLEQ